ncbi:hypothetical protein SK128_020118 [Halocaridina rubra]|uniref:C2H2-type domain-containing protein n=1 Tax=Halocaridina rubra TaxID=373956 RepID=A0AAN9AFJ7_HALRR
MRIPTRMRMAEMDTFRMNPEAYFSSEMERIPENPLHLNPDLILYPENDTNLKDRFSPMDPKLDNTLLPLASGNGNKYSHMENPVKKQYIPRGRRRMTQGGKEFFHCPDCSYSSPRRDHLRSHMVTHRGEKPHQCPYCLYRSRFKTGLTSHIRTHMAKKSLSII